MTEYIMRYENEVLQLLPDKIQQLIRCKDCKKRGTINCCVSMATEREIYADWFCADGERNDETH